MPRADDDGAPRPGEAEGGEEPGELVDVGVERVRPDVRGGAVAADVVGDDVAIAGQQRRRP